MHFSDVGLSMNILRRKTAVDIEISYCKFAYFQDDHLSLTDGALDVLPSYTEYIMPIHKDIRQTNAWNRNEVKEDSLEVVSFIASCFELFFTAFINQHRSMISPIHANHQILDAVDMFWSFEIAIKQSCRLI